MLVDSERAISSETAHESALRAMEYLQAGACRSLMETLDAMERPKISLLRIEDAN
jgi:hypothetical protein